MKKYEELTDDEKDKIMQLTFIMYNHCSGWTLEKEDYEQMIEYFNELKGLING